MARRTAYIGTRLEPALAAALQERADRNERSLSSELRLILRDALMKTAGVQAGRFEPAPPAQMESERAPA